jgi:hypothetical protein
MVRIGNWTVLFLLLGAMKVSAEPAKFRLQKGQVLAYKVVQTTKITETLIDDKTGKPADMEHSTTHTVTRKWTVAEVDANGVATLEMTIGSMKWEEKLPNGETDIFDSAKPDDLNQKEMAKLLGTIQAIVRIDAQGQLVEVKKGNANRIAADLPFKMTLPKEGVKEGQSWDRKFTIKLDPPDGTGETYEAAQNYTGKASEKGYNVVAITTTIKEMPMQAADQIPLLPRLMEGNIYFEPTAGIYYAARFKIKKELPNHAGPGTKYVYESTYAEDYQGDK